MAENDGIQLELSLDDKQVTRQVETLEDKFKKFGDSIGGSLKGANKFIEDFGGKAIALNQGLELAGKAMAAFQKAGELFMKSVDFVKLGESVKAVEARFELMADKSVGAGNTLKQAFEDATHGLVDTEDVLQAAIKSMSALGGQANKLPAIFELSTKVAKTFGQDAIQTFEEFSQAITAGSAKSMQFKQLGIDGAEVFKKYADSIGTSADKLSLLQKQTALTNALLEQGSKNLQTIDPNITSATDAFKRFGVSLDDATEGVAVAFSQTFGPFFKAMADFGTNILTNVSTQLKATFGSSTERAAAQITILEERISAAKSQMTDFNKQFNPGIYASAEQSLARFSKELSNLKDIQSAANDDARKASRFQPGIPQAVLDAIKASQLPIPTREEVQKRNYEFQQSLLKAQQENIQLQEQIAQAKLTGGEDPEATARRLANQQLQSEELVHQQRMAEIRNAAEGDKKFTQAQTNALIETENQRHQLQMEKVEADSAAVRLKVVQNLANGLKATFVNGVTQTLVQVTQSLMKGNLSFENFAGGILGIVGDMAINLGQALIAQGLALEAFIDAINTLLPGSGAAAAAVGVGLVIFGAALKSQFAQSQANSGPSAGLVNSGATPSMGGIGSEPGLFTGNDDAGDEAIAKPGTTVNLTVQGNILDRRQTGLELSEVIREAVESQGTVAVQGAFA